MKKLLNVLYVTAPESYLSLDGENVVIKKSETVSMRLPLHNLENIVCFSYTGASPALMGACAERNIGLCFLTPHGRFLARVSGKVKGNVLLRKRQFEVSQMEVECLRISSSMLIGKLSNCRKVIERAIRDHPLSVDPLSLREASGKIKENMKAVHGCATIADLMGFEGSSAKIYFSVFDQLILQQKEAFRFTGRTRRPPLDNINA